MNVPKMEYCAKCNTDLRAIDKKAIWNGQIVCVSCYDKSYRNLPILRNSGIDPEKLRKMASDNVGKVYVNSTAAQMGDVSFNEPAHYHQHEIDTITFLQKGFPPDVFMGFAIGHVVKYAQRSKYKGSQREDLVKMADYAKRALDWYDKTHS